MSIYSFAGRLKPADVIRWSTETLSMAWRRAMRPAWIVVATSAVLLAALCAFTDFGFAPLNFIVDIVIVQTALLVTAAVLVRAGHARFAVATETTALFISTFLIMPPLESIFAAAAFPFCDDMLVAADRALGIDWVKLAFWFRSYPTFTKLLGDAYGSIEWQPMVLIAALAFADPERLRRIMTAATLALAVTVIVFLVLPAIGPYAYFNFSSSDFPSVIVPVPWVAPGITEALRAGDHHVRFAGLVTFPSFHAAVAVLFAYGWAAVPVLRWLFVPLNLLMLVSCVPIGSHYVTDVIVGVAIAAVFYRVADRYFAATDATPSLPRWQETAAGRALQTHIIEAFAAKTPAGHAPLRRSEPARS